MNKEREKLVEANISKLKKAQISEIGTSLEELKPYIPEFTRLIVNKCLPKFFEVLSKKELSGSAQKEIISFLYYSIKNRNENRPDTDPYGDLFKDSRLLSTLFQHAKDANIHLLEILQDLYLFNPDYFQSYIIHSPKTIDPLIQSIYINQSIEAARLLQRLMSTSPEIMRVLTPQIIPYFKQYPVTIVIDFMFTNPDLKDFIPSGEFEEWLLSHQCFSILDIEASCSFFRQIWSNQTGFILMSKSVPTASIAQIHWISKMKPQNIVPEAHIINQCVHSLLHPQYSMIAGSNEQASYFFTRFYALSLVDPASLSEEIINFVLFKIIDSHDFTSISATQTILHWVMKYKSQPPAAAVFLAASEAANEKRSHNLRCVYSALLRTLSMFYSSAASVIKADPSLLFTQEMSKPLKPSNAPWMFPHISSQIIKVANIEVFDYSNALTLIGFISDFIGLHTE